uniref:Beta-defensin n=1 Tax=Callithrix jacchus TaxID=9483 RepID=A0A2R8P0I8_CALJA
MSVMKPCLMTIVILMILAQKTPGGLFRSHKGKSGSWNPCELYEGVGRNTCREYEIQYLTCPNDQKCCLKLSVKTTSSKNVKENYDSHSNLSVMNSSSHSHI